MLNEARGWVVLGGLLSAVACNSTVTVYGPGGGSDDSELPPDSVFTDVEGTEECDEAVVSGAHYVEIGYRNLLHEVNTSFPLLGDHCLAIGAAFGLDLPEHDGTPETVATTCAVAEEIAAESGAKATWGGVDCVTDGGECEPCAGVAECERVCVAAQQLGDVTCEVHEFAVENAPSAFADAVEQILLLGARGSMMSTTESELSVASSMLTDLMIDDAAHCAPLIDPVVELLDEIGEQAKHTSELDFIADDITRPLL